MCVLAIGFHLTTSFMFVDYVKDPDMFWDFITLRPETIHQITYMFTDRGTPDGFRHMNGYGSHTFKMVNAAGEAIYCKFHMKVSLIVLTVFLLSFGFWDMN